MTCENSNIHKSMVSYVLNLNWILLIVNWAMYVEDSVFFLCFNRMSS